MIRHVVNDVRLHDASSGLSHKDDIGDAQNKAWVGRISQIAGAYLVSFIMQEYKDDDPYTIFHAVLQHFSKGWTVPYVSSGMEAKQKDEQFDCVKPSAMRCLSLKYKPIRNPNKQPDAIRSKLQKFEDKGMVSFWQSESEYQQQVSGVAGLLAAFMAIRDTGQLVNPIGVDSGHCWKWIMYLLHLPQCFYPEAAAVLGVVIENAGYQLKRKYPQQFPKLTKYIEETVHNTMDASTAARGRAKTLLRQALDQAGKEQPPKLAKQHVPITDEQLANCRA